MVVVSLRVLTIGRVDAGRLVGMGSGGGHCGAATLLGKTVRIKESQVPFSFSCLAFLGRFGCLLVCDNEEQYT